MILKSKIDASQNPGEAQYSGGSNYAYDAPTRLDEIKDQIVVNARLSVLANEEVNELANIQDRDEDFSHSRRNELQVKRRDHFFDSKSSFHR
jgi:hypothetical protein